MSKCTPAQAWSILSRHAEHDGGIDVTAAAGGTAQPPLSSSANGSCSGGLRLRDLCRDEDRVASLVAVRNSSVDGDDDDGGHMLLVDLSRQRMTTDTVQHLFRLAASREIRESIKDLAWGRLAAGAGRRRRPRPPAAATTTVLRDWNRENCGDGCDEYDDAIGGIAAAPSPHFSSPSVSFAAGPPYRHDDGGGPSPPVGGSMHLAFRAPAGAVMQSPYDDDDRGPSTSDARTEDRRGVRPGGDSRERRTPLPSGPPLPGGGGEEEATNALDEIHGEWRRIRSLSDSVRRGKLRGASGSALRDVLVVAAPGTVVSAALRFLYDALRGDAIAGEGAALDIPVRKSPSPSSGGGSGGGSGGVMGAMGIGGMVTTPFKKKQPPGGGSRGGGAAAASSTVRREQRRMRFVSSVDPAVLARAVLDLDPRATVIVTLSVDAEREPETKWITLAARSWLLSGIGASSVRSGSGSGGAGGSRGSGTVGGVRPEAVVRRQMYLVTGKDSLKRADKSESVFLLPQHSRCEAFSTFSAAGLFPLSIVFGWKTVESFLAGAHDLDAHLVESPPRHNLPVLLALTDVWNGSFLGSRGRVVTPFSEAFGSYPAFVAALEGKVLGGGSSDAGDEEGTLHFLSSSRAPPAPSISTVIDGGPDGAYDEVLYRGNPAMHTELIVALDPRTTSIRPGTPADGGVLSDHDARICAAFAYADTLAFGEGGGRSAATVARGGWGAADGTPPPISSVDSMLSSHGAGVGSGGGGGGGNRPSTLIVCGTCDAFACGQLVALAEHRALVGAWLRGVDPFPGVTSECHRDATFGDDNPSRIRTERTEYLEEKLDGLFRRIASGEDTHLDSPEGGDNDDEGGAGAPLNLATSTILTHYANRMQRYKQHRDVKSPIKLSHNRFSDNNYY